MTSRSRTTAFCGDPVRCSVVPNSSILPVPFQVPLRSGIGLWATPAVAVTHAVAGQDGPLIWGTTSSANNDSKEPFAWALSQDNKTIVGADTDGYYRIAILSADQIEKFYAQNALGPRQAIVATCFVMNRIK